MESTHLKNKQQKSQPIRHLTTGLPDCYQGIEESLVYIRGITVCNSGK